MKISIFGSGYVGLVSGACFAELGNDVLCCDIDKKKIDGLKKGVIPIYEPGLEEMVKRNIKESRLFFSANSNEAVNFGEIIFIAVGTPSKNYGDADLKYVYAVAETIGDKLNRNDIIVVGKSTVPIGTADEVRNIIGNKIKKRGETFRFAVVSNPEFLKEGSAIDDFMKPDRVVIGTNEDWAKKKMEELNSPLIKSGHLIFAMDARSAEMSKYAANVLLATKISFINQIANLCEAVGADVEEVRKAISADKRIGHHFIYPGIGYGGSCFPKDVRALSALVKKIGYPTNLVEAVEMINETQKEILAKKLLKELRNVEGLKIAVWGLSFKPHTDDMRSAPSIAIIEKLLAKGAKISAYDPVAIEEAKKIFNNRIEYSENMYDCLKGAEALLLITEWPQFKEPDFVKMKELLNRALVVDGRNIYSPEKMRKIGFTYVSVGRPDVKY